MRRFLGVLVALVVAWLGVAQPAVATPRRAETVVSYIYDGHHSSVFHEHESERGRPRTTHEYTTTGSSVVDVALNRLVVRPPGDRRWSCITYDPIASHVQVGNGRTGTRARPQPADDGLRAAPSATFAEKAVSRVLSKVDDIPCNCLVAGTTVQTAKGAKPIEDVRPGDQVWAKNLATGESELRPVTGLFQKQSTTLMTITLASGATVVVTQEHPFMVDGEGWVLSGDLRVGDHLTKRDGGGLTIAAIESRTGSEKVYNFEVAGDHNYYITDAQLLVHNCKLIPANGSRMTVDEALTRGQQWLGEGYTEPVAGSGRYVSRDGSRVFRMGASDITGRHGGGPHVNFETLVPNPARPGRLMVGEKLTCVSDGLVTYEHVSGTRRILGRARSGLDLG